MNCNAAGSSVRAHGDRSLIMADMISGINIPDSKIAREAAELVRQYETEMLFNHSVRVFVFGAMKGIRQKIKFDSELLYVAALFHDLGLVDAFHTETNRFEVDGADAARAFLRSHGIPEPKADLVWEAIALHTTPGIPQHMRPQIALTNAGVLGGVDSKDSLLGANQIQGCYLGGSLGCEGPFGFERRDVGADGAADYRST